MLRFCCFLFLLKSTCGGIFELTDVDDSFSMFWQANKLERRQTECKAETKSGIKYGVCEPHSACLFAGGTTNGFCGLFTTCCIFENSCAKTSDTKVGYFEANDLTNGITTCNYNIKLKNTNICQVRLDFVKFNLAPAALTLPQYATHKIYKCLDDRLRILPNHYNIPDLCGNNDKQHVYVHVNQSDGITKGVQLQMTLADRNFHSHLFAPSWKIKVTQLECPGEKKGFNLPSNDVTEDFPLLAPLGAIQYYTEPNGYIKSFGFDGSVFKQISYSYGQKYAIAFKRDINICGVRFSPEYINIPNDHKTGLLTDNNCQHYIFVPDLYFDRPTSPSANLISKVCLKENEPFRSYAPGPFYIFFNSLATNFAADENVQQGFNIKYELLGKCQ